MKPIDKDTLITEIEKRKEGWRFGSSIEALFRKQELDELLDFINTLEVKELDLEEALSDLDKEIKEFVTTEEFEKDSAIAGHYWAIAKHAFLLGLKAYKGE